jgi:hypothetical protein
MQFSRSFCPIGIGIRRIAWRLVGIGGAPEGCGARSSRIGRRRHLGPAGARVRPALGFGRGDGPGCRMSLDPRVPGRSQCPRRWTSPPRPQSRRAVCEAQPPRHTRQPGAVDAACWLRAFPLYGWVERELPSANLLLYTDTAEGYGWIQSYKREAMALYACRAQ